MLPNWLGDPSSCSKIMTQNIVPKQQRSSSGQEVEGFRLAKSISTLKPYRAGVTKFGPGGPAEFSSNPNQTHLKQLIKVLIGILQTSRQVCWGKLELNSAGHRPSRIKFDDPCYRVCILPAKEETEGSNPPKLKEAAVKAWKSITKEECKSLVMSMGQWAFLTIVSVQSTHFIAFNHSCRRFFFSSRGIRYALKLKIGAATTSIRAPNITTRWYFKLLM